MRGEKSQVVLEFIMTYGWMLVAVLVTISALVYFGVLKPDTFFPKKCLISRGFACMDSKAEYATGSLMINIRQGTGTDLTNVTISASDCTNPAVINEFEKADQQTFTISGCSWIKGQKYYGEINITYIDVYSGLNHTAYGSVVDKVS